MSNWSYVALAFGVAWGSLALYGLLLARRVTQAQRVAKSLREAIPDSGLTAEQDCAVCDAPPAP